MKFALARPSTIAPLLALALIACVTTTDGMPERKTPTSPWLEPSALLRQQIEDQAQRLPWTQGRERIEQIHWFATVGEPAYEKLLQLAQDERPDVAGSALAALGATRDSRLVASLRQIDWSETCPLALRYERARMFLRLGDWREAPVLIGGLRDSSLMMRALCAQALFEATGERLGYDAKEPALVREEGTLRWEAWWKDREHEGILTAAH
ncbi:MAG TPA: hypothetical protein VM509_08195 [Planctomycetota bacterium]|nr:hypothetical protein [Planctomycetota bacterium]